MIKKYCYIFGAAKMHGHLIEPQTEDLIIAADGGYKMCKKLNLEPDVLIGDFDSLKTNYTAKETISLPQEKDDTDMLAAIKLGFSKGYSYFLIYGGTGGRIDHTLANIQALVFISTNGGRGWLYEKHCVITAITNSAVTFNANYRGYVSIFAANGTAHGVNESGLKYELSNAEINESFPIGVSNEFLGNESKISVLNGTLIIVYPDLGEQI